MIHPPDGNTSHQREIDLLSLCRLLWQEPTRAVLGPAGQHRGATVLRQLLFVPTAERARILVPVVPRSAAAAGLRRYSNGLSGVARAGRALAALGLQVGLTQLFLRDQLTIEVDGALEPGLEPRIAIDAFLREVLGWPELVLCVTVGTERANRKPVLQILSPEGGTVAYAKVGWNDMTRALVRNEAASVTGLPLHELPSVMTPRLLHQFEWNDLDVIVLSPLPQNTWGRRRRGSLPLAQMRDVAVVLGVTRVTLGESGYWSTVRDRVQACRALPLGDRLEATFAQIEERYGGTDVAFGAWHGDWAPWNMEWHNDRLMLWDWERSSPCAPIGFDPLHFAFQTAYQLQGRGEAGSAEACRDSAHRVIPEMGVDQAPAAAISLLYLFELVLRCIEGTAVPMGIHLLRLSSNLIGVVEREAAV